MEWTRQTVEALERRIADLLSRACTPVDVPALREALEAQTVLLQRCYEMVGRQAQELEALQALLGEEDEATDWDQGDERQ